MSEVKRAHEQKYFPYLLHLSLLPLLFFFFTSSLSTLTYIYSPDLLLTRSGALNPVDVLRLEQDVFVPLAGNKRLYVFEYKGFWRQIKNAGTLRPPSTLIYKKTKKGEKKKKEKGMKGEKMKEPQYFSSIIHHHLFETHIPNQVLPCTATISTRNTSCTRNPRCSRRARAS